MKHLGDITKINGAEIEPVDCVTFGSPCQDLSVAGKRAGLAGERSGLFMEAVRIIKEMRCKTNGMYPTFAIWENVPGAFSSNSGDDFRAVLEELARVVGPSASIPRPAKRWEHAGCVLGDGWSIAWRLMDAQYWGVPQRRKRIALVADFGGHRAPQILFEQQGLSGYLESGITPWQSSPGASADCTGATGIDLYNQSITGGVSKSLNSAATDADHVPCTIQEDSNICNSSGGGISATLDASYYKGPGSRNRKEREVIAVM